MNQEEKGELFGSILITFLGLQGYGSHLEFAIYSCSPINLGDLEQPFLEDEIRDAIKSLTKDKALGYDDFT